MITGVSGPLVKSLAFELGDFVFEPPTWHDMRELRRLHMSLFSNCSPLPRFLNVFYAGATERLGYVADTQSSHNTGGCYVIGIFGNVSVSSTHGHCS